MSEEQAPTQVQGDCPDCGRNRWAIILGEKEIRWEVDYVGLWGSDTYRLLECAGCKVPYYQHISISSEDVHYEGESDTPILIPKSMYFPSLSKRGRPNWLSVPWRFEHDDLMELLGSLYTALDMTSLYSRQAVFGLSSTLQPLSLESTRH